MRKDIIEGSEVLLIGLFEGRQLNGRKWLIDMLRNWVLDALACLKQGNEILAIPSCSIFSRVSMNRG